MVITCWVHAVDTARFPAVPEGTWRWCLGAGEDPADARMWFNAWLVTPDDQLGYPPKTFAAIEGEQHGASVAAALHLAGIDPIEKRTVVLDYDPCADDAYDLPLHKEL